jgi:hypothetical protein
MTSPIDAKRLEELIAELRNAAEPKRFGVLPTRKLYGEAATALASLKAENERLREALKFYRDGWDFKTTKKRSGLEWHPKEALLDDCGNIARAALTDAGKPAPDAQDSKT